MQIYISKDGVAIPIYRQYVPEYYAGIACMYTGPVYILKLLISLHAN